MWNPCGLMPCSISIFQRPGTTLNIFVGWMDGWMDVFLPQNSKYGGTKGKRIPSFWLLGSQVSEQSSGSEHSLLKISVLLLWLPCDLRLVSSPEP